MTGKARCSPLNRVAQRSTCLEIKRYTRLANRIEFSRSLADNSGFVFVPRSSKFFLLLVGGMTRSGIDIFHYCKAQRGMKLQGLEQSRGKTRTVIQGRTCLENHNLNSGS